MMHHYDLPEAIEAEIVMLTDLDLVNHIGSLPEVDSTIYEVVGRFVLGSRVLRLHCLYMRYHTALFELGEVPHSSCCEGRRNELEHALRHIGQLLRLAQSQLFSRETRPLSLVRNGWVVAVRGQPLAPDITQWSPNEHETLH